ncbi:MAG: SprT-like domain-containing protein [Lachnotalea sp.]
MNEQSLKPVIEKLEKLFSSFNTKFYNGELEKPIITVSPDSTKGAYGWCTSWKAWKKSEAKDNEGYYEINMCAEHLSRPFKETCSTLLHEMVHLYNLQNNIQDTSRGGTYHNKKFKEIAEQHGLIIEQHPKYGWTLTKLNEEAEQFIEDMKEQNFQLYRDSAAKLKAKKSEKQSSRKYVCPCCGIIIRATKEVRVECMTCGMEMEEE